MNEGAVRAERSILELAILGTTDKLRPTEAREWAAARTWRGLISRGLLDSDGSLGGRKQPLVTHGGEVGMVVPTFSFLSFSHLWLMLLLDQTPNRTETKKTHGMIHEGQSWTMAQPGSEWLLRATQQISSMSGTQIVLMH